MLEIIPLIFLPLFVFLFLYDKSRQHRKKLALFSELEAVKKTTKKLSSDLENKQFLLKEKTILAKLSQQLIEASNLSNLLDEEDFEKQFQQIAKAIGESFEVEYCNIGLYQEDELIDCAVWTPYPKTEEVNNFLEETSLRPQSETLVGAAIRASGNLNEAYFHWDHKEKGGAFTNKELTGDFANVDKDILNDYREKVLQSGAFYNFLVFGIYDSNKEPLGYLHIANKLDNGKVNPDKLFDKKEIEILEKFVKNIALLIENVRFHQLSNKDERTINQFYEINNIDPLLSEILKYLNEEFNSIIGAYLMLAKNGFASENKSRVVLRSVEFLNEEYKVRYESKIRDHAEADPEDSLSGQIIMDMLTSHKYKEQESIKFFDFRAEGISIMWDFVEETNYVIGIPIMKSPPFEKGSRPQDKIWGVLCLQPRENHENEANQARLHKIAKHIQILLEKIIYERRYHQIRRLDLKLQELESSKATTSVNYTDIVNVVKEVSHVEACSIFFASKNKEHLYLKATTASRAYRQTRSERELLAIEYLIKNKIPLYEIGDDNKAGITGRAFDFRESVLVYDIGQNPFTYWVFVEGTNSLHKSIAVIPLINESGECFGVLRCVNKIKENRLLPFFVEGDLEVLKLITGITMSFMFNYEFQERRQTAMSHFAHENRIPMQAVQDDKSVLVFQLNKILPDIPKGIKETLDLLEKNLGILMNNVLISESAFLEDPKKKKVTYKKVSLHDLIRGLRKKFYIKVIPYTSEAPELLIDEKQIYQVFYNLILNAQRYSSNGAPVKIFYAKSQTYPTEGYHQFKIQNRGIGIVEGEEEAIFQAYFRSEQAKEKYPTGTGIGLKVCKDIMENHDGLIKVTKNRYPTEISIFFPPYLTNTKPNT